MTDSIRRKIEGSQGRFEKLVGSIPGYKGYKERELRREADKLLRTHLADRLDEQRRRLSQVMTELTSATRLGELPNLERASQRLQLAIDRLRTASYGYAGLFDAVKIQQKELDALYAFDAQLAGEIDRVKEAVSSLEKKLANDGGTAPEAKALLAVLQEFNETWSRRSAAITGSAE